MTWYDKLIAWLGRMLLSREVTEQALECQCQTKRAAEQNEARSIALVRKTSRAGRLVDAADKLDRRKVWQ